MNARFISYNQCSTVFSFQVAIIVVCYFTVHPNVAGMVLVSGSADHIAIWDLDNMVTRNVIAVHNDQVNHIQLQVCPCLLLHCIRRVIIPARCQIMLAIFETNYNLWRPYWICEANSCDLMYCNVADVPGILCQQALSLDMILSQFLSHNVLLLSSLYSIPGSYCCHQFLRRGYQGVRHNLRETNHDVTQQMRC